MKSTTRHPGSRGTLLAIDVGGTRTRAVLAALRGGKPAICWQVETALAGKAALGSFLRNCLRDAGVDRCAVDFAGPLKGGTEARMTNWAGNPVIRLTDLLAWGLPPGRTLMLNDLEASACGVLALDGTESPRGRVTTLYPTNETRRGAERPRVVIAPGTGLGTASIIGGRPMPSEVQHAAAAPLDHRHALIIARVENGLGRYPSWEDLASGRGLEAMYRALCAIDRAPAGQSALKGAVSDAAGAIARAAQSDPRAREALDYYYGCVGRVAQTLALAVLPAGGIFLCGSTTRANATFIRHSRFLRELHANAVQGGLLRRFPVLIIKEDLNLAGGLWACAHPDRWSPLQS